MVAQDVGTTTPDSLPTEPAPAARRPRAGSGRRTLVGFLLLFGLLAVWSLSTPLFAAPDESSQATRAAGAADGQIFGRPDTAAGPSSVSFSVPAVLAQRLGDNPPCFAFLDTVPASCQTYYATTTSRIRVATHVGSYPPLYYVIVGLPSVIVPTSGHQLYYMRLVSAALSALFFAAAIVSASQVRGRRWTVIGVAAAVTPSGIFLGSVINPSGLEISAGLCTWISALALFDGPDPRHRRRLLVWTVLSASVFVQLRGLSPLLLAILAVVLTVLVGWRRVLAVLRQRDAQVGLAVVLVCGVFAVVWIFSQHVLVSSTLPSPLLLKGSALHQAIDRSDNVHAMIGLFGWLDTVLPVWVDRVWESIWWLLVIVAVLRRQWRTVAVGLGLAVVVAVLPVALTLHERARFGLIGEARYIMPLAVGLPVLAGYAASGRHEDRGPRRLAVLAAVGIAVVQVASFLVMEQRNRTGVTGPIFTLHAPYSPFLPWLAGVIAIVLLQGAIAVWWVRQVPGAPVGLPRRRARSGAEALPAG
jgi:hypothetical protein